MEDDFFAGVAVCFNVWLVDKTGLLSVLTDPETDLFSICCFGCKPHQYFGCRAVRFGGMTTFDVLPDGLGCNPVCFGGTTTLDVCLSWLCWVLAGFAEAKNRFSVDEAFLGCTVGATTRRLRTGVKVTMEVLVVGFFRDASAAV